MDINTFLNSRFVIEVKRSIKKKLKSSRDIHVIIMPVQILFQIRLPKSIELLNMKRNTNELSTFMSKNHQNYIYSENNYDKYKITYSGIQDDNDSISVRFIYFKLLPTYFDYLPLELKKEIAYQLPKDIEAFEQISYYKLSPIDYKNMIQLHYPANSEYMRLVYDLMHYYYNKNMDNPQSLYEIITGIEKIDNKNYTKYYECFFTSPDRSRTSNPLMSRVYLYLLHKNFYEIVSRNIPEDIYNKDIKLFSQVREWTTKLFFMTLADKESANLSGILYILFLLELKIVPTNSNELVNSFEAMTNYGSQLIKHEQELRGLYYKSLIGKIDKYIINEFKDYLIENGLDEEVAFIEDILG